MEIMRAPEVCVYCDVRLSGHDGTWAHVLATPCRQARPCDQAERDLRWEDWRRDAPQARAAGRDGAAHMLAYGTTDTALCGGRVVTRVPAESGMTSCRAGQTPRPVPGPWRGVVCPGSQAWWAWAVPVSLQPRRMPEHPPPGRSGEGRSPSSPAV